MKIKKVYWQHRYDFMAILECEHCGNHRDLDTGYNDEHYVNKVIPAITCTHCLKDSNGNIPNEPNPDGLVWISKD